ncbi:MAG: hypothetical protein PWR17_272 [Candidatus Methanomethylophilaceae archaeon]|nr:hypothetical protein [Candidatus Methanomethylophilaceae archaeon]
MNEATLEYILGIAETDIQKKIIQLFSEKISPDVDPDILLREILKYMREGEQ